MRTKYGLFASAATLAFGFAGLFSSCEDTCVNCNCDAFYVDYIVNSDSMDVQLSELTSQATIVIVGSGLSSANAVYLVDQDNNQYPLPLNPTFVTDEAIVVTLESDANTITTDKLLVTSSTGCSSIVEISKPVPAPSIKMFYSEFVDTGDTLRIAGNAFLDFPGDPLRVYFYDENDKEISAEYVVDHNNSELLVVVPEGVADSKPVSIKNHFGETTSSMLFRDRRNVFMDFDVSLPGNECGALDHSSNNFNSYVQGLATYVNYTDMVEAMGGMPKGCSGYYTVLTSVTDYNFKIDEMVHYTPYSQGLEKKSLLGDFSNEDLENLVLKFEVLVPSQVPLGSWLYAVFAAYGSEDDQVGGYCEENEVYYSCFHFPRDYTQVKGFDPQTYTCAPGGSGVPGAWLNMATISIDDSKETPTYSLGEAFHTNGKWMTIAIPLSHEYFKYNIKDYNLTTNDNFVSCGTLTKEDFGNFFLHVESGGFQSQLTSKFGNHVFIAVDNFRIVPDDGGGVRFSKYYGATPASKYPF